MALKTLTGGGSARYLRPSNMDEGFTLEGYYLETDSSGDFGPTHYFQVTKDVEANVSRPAGEFEVETLGAGSRIGINSASRLNFAMNKAEQNLLTIITYKGKEKNKKGKLVHSFEVVQDDEVILEGGHSGSSTEAAIAAMSAKAI